MIKMVHVGLAAAIVVSLSATLFAQTSVHDRAFGTAEKLQYLYQAETTALTRDILPPFKLMGKL